MPLEDPFELGFISGLGEERDGVRRDLVLLDLAAQVLQLRLAALLLKDGLTLRQQVLALRKWTWNGQQGIVDYGRRIWY